MTHRELETHLSDLFEGQIGGEALQALQDELRSNEEARLAYRDHARLQNALSLRAEGTDPLRVIPMDQVVERRQRRQLKVAGMAAAALVAGAGLAMLFTLIRTPRPSLTIASSPGTQLNLSTVTGEDPVRANTLEPGSRLEITRGTVELNFASGVRGIVSGPADLTLQQEGVLHLARGSAWFEVPSKAVGFTVNTPALNLVDLGTEFGIFSQPNALDEVHVFTGKVEVTNRYGLKDKVLIKAGQARIAGPAGRWLETALQEDTFLTELPLTKPDASEHLVFQDSFVADNSDEYVCLDYHKGGEWPNRFRVGQKFGGVLEILAGTGRGPAQVVHRSARLEPGQIFRVDWLTPARSGYSISQVLTNSTDGLRYCVRLRVNDGAYVIDFERGHQGTVEWADRSPYVSPDTFWIARLSPTEFAWFRGPDKSELTRIADLTFDSNPGQLLVGVQAWDTDARFDNFEIIKAEVPAKPADETGDE